MTVNIEKMRTELAAAQRDYQETITERQTHAKWETRKFAVQLAIAAAALLAAGVAIGRFVVFHQ